MLKNSKIEFGLRNQSSRPLLWLPEWLPDASTEPSGFKEHNLQTTCVRPGAIKLWSADKIWPAAISICSLILCQFYKEELSSCDRDHITHQAKNIYCLALDRKSLLTLMLNELQVSSLLSYSIISSSKGIDAKHRFAVRILFHTSECSANPDSLTPGSRLPCAYSCY